MNDAVDHVDSRSLAASGNSGSTPFKSGRRVPAWAKTALVVVSVILTLGLLEFAARVYAWSIRRERILTYDSISGWRPIAGASQFDDDGYPYQIQINSHGLRDKEYEYERTEDVGRILVVGDSFVFGSGGVNEAERFTEILENRLGGTEVLNAGVPGFSTDQEYLFLREEGLRYAPDVVLLCLFVNDFEQCFTSYSDSTGKPKGYISEGDGGTVQFHDPPPMRWRDRLSYTSYLFGGLDRRLGAASAFYESSRVDVDLDESSKIRLYESLLRRFCDLCREHGATLIMMYIPFKGEIHEETVVWNAMLRVAKAQEVAVVDLKTCRSFKSVAAEEAYFENDMHLSAIGHEAVATDLEEFFIGRGVKRRAAVADSEFHSFLAQAVNVDGEIRKLLVVCNKFGGRSHLGPSRVFQPVPGHAGDQNLAYSLDAAVAVKPVIVGKVRAAPPAATSRSVAGRASADGIGLSAAGD